MARAWTNKEIQTLKNNFGVISTAELAIELKRTRQAVLTKASRLGLKSELPYKGPLDVESIKYYLCEFYSVGEIADVLGTSRSAISKRIHNNPKHFDSFDKRLSRNNYRKVKL